ncbi:hypothetical protein AVEN_28190-1, partial [Araneus ventricosus]
MPVTLKPLVALPTVAYLFQASQIKDYLIPSQFAPNVLLNP